MREILFRGKRKGNGEWVYGSLLIQSGEWINKDEQAPTEYRILGCRGENYLAIPETVGQYTGMTDKNGTKIFEGDILKIIDGKEIIIASVKFGDYNQPDKILKTHIGFYFDIANLVSYRKDIGYWFGKTFSEIEVIGNAHDNLELLQD